MITSRSVYIRDTKDRNIKLVFGGCTKMESQLKIPKEGNTVYFKGTERKEQADNKIFEIDVLMMTFYEWEGSLDQFLNSKWFHILFTAYLCHF